MAHYYPILDLDKRYRKVPHQSSLKRLFFGIVIILIGLATIAGMFAALIDYFKPTDPVMKAITLLHQERATWPELRP
jgi:hypothetical protein